MACCCFVCFIFGQAGGDLFVCVTELRFDFLHSFMVCSQTSDFSYTESWNFRISTAHAYKYKTKLQPKMKRRENKSDILLASHQSTYVPEKRSFAYRPYSSKENRNACSEHRQICTWYPVNRLQRHNRFSIWRCFLQLSTISSRYPFFVQ